MTERQYQVVFDGKLTGEYDEATTQARFARLFSLDQKKVRKLFSGGQFVVKKNISEEVAMQFAMKIAEAGCECYIEALSTHPVDPNFKERRTSEERRQRFRRGPRPGAILPDRRLVIRREEDREYIEELILHHGDLPIGFQAYPRDKK